MGRRRYSVVLPHSGVQRPMCRSRCLSRPPRPAKRGSRAVRFPEGFDDVDRGRIVTPSTGPITSGPGRFHQFQAPPSRACPSQAAALRSSSTARRGAVRAILRAGPIRSVNGFGTSAEPVAERRKRGGDHYPSHLGVARRFRTRSVPSRAGRTSSSSSFGSGRGSEKRHAKPPEQTGASLPPAESAFRSATSTSAGRRPSLIAIVLLSSTSRVKLRPL